MLKVKIDNDSLLFGEGFGLNFQRTLRIPDDGKTYPLPPGLGQFPIFPVEKYAVCVPDSWRERRGVFIPMYQREALWICFRSRYWKPNAVKVAVGMVNAVSGRHWDEHLHPGENDYMVCPPQPWLDGIKAGEGYIRQFVAMPLGMGYTVEAQVTGKEEFGGIQIIVYEPKPGKFPDEAPAFKMNHLVVPAAAVMDRSVGAEMGLGAGGKMKQSIYPDPHGVDTWDEENTAKVCVHIVNSLMFREITGNEPPATPVSAQTYSQYGLPWFDLYDDHLGDIPAPEILKGVKSVAQLDQEKGLSAQQDDSSIDIPQEQVIKYKFKKEE